MKEFIPVNEPLLRGNEKKYLNECIDTGWISSEGPFVKEFETRLSERVGRLHGVAVSNGTAALDIAIEALQIGKGDEVILPTFTIISCVHQIVRAGAIPVLVDSNFNTLNMDVSKIEEKITKNTKAIMVVHIYGLTVDMDPVIKIARDNNLYLIEDASEVIGQTYKGKNCGSFGDISTFSFYPNKHITTGEGGMVLMNDKRIYEKCKSLRNLCFKKETRFIHDQIGWNYRMTNLQAALGLAQLEQLDSFVKKKREIGELYNRQLSGINQIILPTQKTEYVDNIYWVYGIIIKEGYTFNAKTIMDRLSQMGVGNRPFFFPMHLQPVLKNYGLFEGENYPVSENLYNNGFYIPSGLGISEEQIIRVSEVLKTIFLK